VNNFVAEEGEDLLQTGGAMPSPPVHPLAPAACGDCVHLSRGPPVGPTHHGPHRTACCAVARLGGTPSQRLQQGQLIPGLRVRKDRGQMPGPETTLGVVPQAQSLRLRPCAPPTETTS
jgi:hypothetical protein